VPFFPKFITNKEKFFFLNVVFLLVFTLPPPQGFQKLAGNEQKGLRTNFPILYVIYEQRERVFHWDIQT
jgi:hypothetical protein